MDHKLVAPPHLRFNDLLRAPSILTTHIRPYTTYKTIRMPSPRFRSTSILRLYPSSHRLTRSASLLCRSTPLYKQPLLQHRFTKPLPTRTMSFKRMTERLTGRTIFITGASSGMGRATALEFARTAPTDIRLILTARREEKLHELAAEIKKEVGDGVKCLCRKLDMADTRAVEGFVNTLPTEWKEVDCLVNNA